MASPACAPSRRSARERGTAPHTTTSHTTVAPWERSPPARTVPAWPACSNRPRKKPFTQAASHQGASASETRQKHGSPPIAAMSPKRRASAFQPISAARCVARRKCVSSTSKSVVDRKSTRLNSSHLGTSYAVFCLKKKRSRTPPVRARSDHAHSPQHRCPRRAARQLRVRSLRLSLPLLRLSAFCAWYSFFFWPWRHPPFPLLSPRGLSPD